MRIIIDAYNLIKFVEGDSFISEKRINQWIEKFLNYVELRGNRVDLVFDAGPGLYKMKDQFGALTIFYSGQYQSADDLINEMVDQGERSNLLVVSSDREILDFAKARSVAAVRSDDFHRAFVAAMRVEEKFEKRISEEIEKTSRVDIDGLDQLMERGSRNLAELKKVDEPQVVRVKCGKKVAKQDKRLLRKMEKI